MSQNKWLKRPDEAVMIMWEDHSQTNDTDAPMDRAFMQQTIGFVTKETDQVVILARDFDEDGDYYEHMTILKKNIIRRRKLR